MIVKFSYFVFFVLLIAVILNAVYISQFTEKIYSISQEECEENIPALKEKFRRIYEIYDKNELFVSLTVSHEDLTDIEQILAEINGALTAQDVKAVLIAKSRLENAVLHLGQLSVLNIESIF